MKADEPTLEVEDMRYDEIKQNETEIEENRIE